MEGSIGVCNGGKKGCKCRPTHFCNSNMTWKCKRHLPKNMLQSSKFNTTVLMRMSRAKLNVIFNEIHEANEMPIPDTSHLNKAAAIDQFMTKFAFLIHSPAPAVAKKDEKIGANDMKIDMIAAQLRHILVPLLETYPDIDHVAIETQMGRRMKSVQDMLVMFFTMRSQTIPHIESVSARNKLAIYAEFAQESYDDRKDSSKKIVDALVNSTHTQWRSFWTSHKAKQDDLADSLLQGLWYAKQIQTERPRYILSIDVGIKNLALCLLHVHDSERNEIALWENLDIRTALN